MTMSPGKRPSPSLLKYGHSKPMSRIARHRSACRASFSFRIYEHQPDFAMTDVKFNSALIVGAGPGLSASLARALSGEKIKVALAARSTGDLDALVKETGARAFACDAAERGEVEKLFADVEASVGTPDIVIYNASFRTRGPFVELDPLDVQKSLAVTAYGAFLVAQQAARRMLPKKHGAILLTGASAGVKGYPQSAPFAMGKFALR